MRLAASKIGAATVIAVQGTTIDVQCIDDFKYCLEPIGESGGYVVLDLDQLERIDWEGLNAIAWLQKRLTANNGELRVCGIRPDLQAVFQSAGMHRIVAMFSSQHEAIESFGPSQVEDRQWERSSRPK